MQVVATDMTDAGVDPLAAGLRFPPVLAELPLAAHGLLGTAQPVLVPPEPVERGHERAVRKRGESRPTHIDADRAAMRNGLLDFARRLSCNESMTRKISSKSRPVLAG